jgi:hypothetical protein
VGFYVKKAVIDMLGSILGEKPDFGDGLAIMNRIRKRFNIILGRWV